MKLIEEVIYSVFSNVLSVPVYTTVPQEQPMSFVTFEKVGGSETNFIKESIIAFQSYGGSVLDAAKLSAQVRDVALRDLLAQPEVVGVHIESDQDYTDTRTKKYRYQCVVSISHY